MKKFSFLLVAAILIGCGGGGGGGGDTSSAPLPPALNVTGTWDTNMIVTGGNRYMAQYLPYTMIAEMKVNMSGSTFSGTYTTLNDISPKDIVGQVTGVVDGDDLSMSIKQGPECPGTFNVIAIINAKQKSMSGTYKGSDCYGTIESTFIASQRSSPGGSPNVTTLAATLVGSNTATLNGNVTPNSLATNAWFEYGTDAGLSTFTSTASQSIGSGTTNQSVNAALTGLQIGTTHYYRIVASNSSGTTKGGIASFTTQITTPFEITYNFSGGFNIYAYPPVPQTDGFDYYFTPVQINTSISGKKVKISSITVSFPAVSMGAVVNWDWEVYIGSTSFGLPTGQFIKTIVDPVNGYIKNAPIKILFAEGDYSAPNPTNYTFNATYDFNTGTLSGTPTPRSLTQAIRSDILLNNGLYAQMFLWTADNRNCYISFGAGTLTVKGEIIP